ncbi:ATP-binding protein [Aurantimonas marianensis]|uniref:ATP-binding protein n=1 Tax=Aurantimonas marianensis TaxID=2920428 RepID=A0A9X2KF67_9HYPH|nr:ATP-binding protein [Aurantimonas marianensis]MCP3055151.1 ATP-binding protein [Aurantimonas marianensis]
MSKNAHFSVDTRLTRILGETYRSSEAALKELVDNAWDADAENVWITLPDPLTPDAIVVRDDGVGMTTPEMRGEYLNIASDKRSRTGERTTRFNRKIKGRKGIGKFAGLTLANRMEISTVARGYRRTLLIDKGDLIENQGDLEAVPLPFNEQAVHDAVTGTTIKLSYLDSRLNFPTSDRLREILIYEYGREDSFKVFVNGLALSIQDLPGSTTHAKSVLPNVGDIDLSFTIAEGKRSPRSPGIILKVNGKAVGRPILFGLDEDEEIPTKLARRVFGEVELTGVEDFVTADWGGILENSKAYQEAQTYIKGQVKASLQETHARDLHLQKARLQKQINRRLQKLPEFRRRYAEEALNNILKRFYGESQERIATIADVALDAMEHDAYWAVLERINASSQGDVGSFAESLEQFGLLELATIGVQATRRRQFLDYLDQLVENPATQEKLAHKALETNLWVLGRQYSTMGSNATLRNIIETYCGTSFKGSRASKRPDLLLAQDYGEAYLLIEFKRPSHDITRDDIAQAEKYRDDLSPRLPSTQRLDIMMLGRGRVRTLDANHMAPSITIHSYAGIISSARTQLDWLIKTLRES